MRWWAAEGRQAEPGPRTVEEVLADARAAMAEEDQREETAADPVAWLRAHRPRRRLIDVLLHGRGP